MATTFPMMPWFPRDFLSSTRGWSVTARGVYRELLDAQWDLGVIPKDPAALQQLIGATADEWADGWARCSVKFVAALGGLQNPRLEDRRAESVKLRDKRVQGAERTNAKRYAQRDAERPADRLAERSQSAPAPDSAPESALGVSSRDSRPRKGTVARTFHNQVIEAYHELCPDLPRVKGWSDKRRRSLDARIRERCKDGKPADQLSYWETFFREQVAASDFLSGRKTDFRCDLEWLLGPQNFLKTIEGKYANRQRNGG